MALASAALGAPLSRQAWLGVVLLSAGVLLVGLARTGLDTAGAGNHRKALGFALANACIIASYTVIDSLGVRAAGDAFSYAAALFLFDGLPFMALVLWRAGPRRAEALAYLRARAALALIGTAASIGSYSIALWAMLHAPVALVAALRETSVVFAALIGTWVLRERFGWGRAAGTVLVVAGVAALRLS
ncbi:EamA family transporter [Comamonas endophytica]|uniref:EamA family transporter n=1 Tax=Comamonas endophytica TaxID=2949090 RepID=UPI00360CCA61